MNISVITPVFNERLNILRCYECLCNQTIDNFEWILIDDGSTDNSVEVIEGIISKHSSESFNIRLIKQENKGAALARKLGIEIASSEFISILDCDDYLSLNAIELAVSKLKNEIDIVCFDVDFMENGHCKSTFNFNVDNWPVDGKTAFTKCIDGWGLHGWFVVRKSIILSSYAKVKNFGKINNINDDELVCRYCFFEARKIDHCKGKYFYVKNPCSTTNKINLKYFMVVNTAIELNFFVSRNFKDDSIFVASNRNLISVFFGVFIRFIRWYSVIENKSEWLDSMYKIACEIDRAKLFKSLRLDVISVKIFLKLILISLFKFVLTK
nr:glycosyltransferase family 2 protein [uncultured Deefgea sp.]